MKLLDKLWKVLESEKDSELKDVLLEVELWEAGRVDVNENGEVWVSGDNGVKEITNLVKNL